MIWDTGPPQVRTGEIICMLLASKPETNLDPPNLSWVMIPVTWRKAVAAEVPQYAMLMRNRVEPQDEDVFVPKSAVADVRELRNWIAEFCTGTYTLFARFSMIDNGLNVERFFDGLIFRFSETTDTVHFRLAFATMT